MTEEYYVGQILNEDERSGAIDWCNEHNYLIVEIEPENGRRLFQIQEIPADPAPTKEQQEQARKVAYSNEVDPLHARKMRKTILDEWTEDDEEEYLAKVKELSEEIEQRYPYPVGE